MEKIIIIGAIPYLYIYSVHFVCMYDRDSCMVRWKLLRSHMQARLQQVTSLIAKNLCFIKDSSQ